LSEAAGLLLRNHPNGQTGRARLEHTHGKGTAWAGRAPQVARAVYDLLLRDPGFALAAFLNRYRSRAGAPDASLDHQGIRLPPWPWHPWT
jgi:hypothetical protein